MKLTPVFRNSSPPTTRTRLELSQFKHMITVKNKCQQSPGDWLIAARGCALNVLEFILQLSSAADTRSTRLIRPHQENPLNVLGAAEVGWVTEPGTCSYLKFVFDLAGVGLGVQPADIVVEGAELAHGDGGVAAEARFQDGVVHEHVLLLPSHGEKR